MKNTLAILMCAVLYTACTNPFSSTPDESLENPDVSIEAVITPTKLTEASFMQLSAELVCLRIRQPNASDAELEAAALDVLDLYAVTEESFDAYQADLLADPSAADRVALGIVGEVQARCQGAAAVE